MNSQGEAQVDVLVRQDLAGWLLKKGWMSSIFTPRWFVLQPDRLVYYSHPAERAVRNGLSLRAADIKVRVLDEEEKRQYQQQHGLVVCSEARVFVLACRSGEEQATWLQGLQNAVARLRWKHGASLSASTTPPSSSFSSSSASSSSFSSSSTSSSHFPRSSSSFLSLSAYLPSSVSFSSQLTQDAHAPLPKYPSFHAQVLAEGFPAPDDAAASGRVADRLESEVLLEDEHEHSAASGVWDEVWGGKAGDCSSSASRRGGPLYHQARSGHEAEAMRAQSQLIDTIAELKQNLFALQLTLRQKEAGQWTPARVAAQLHVGITAPMHRYRRLKDKVALLHHVSCVEPAAEDVLVEVVSWLRATLSSQLFLSLASQAQYRVAVDAYVAHLRRQLQQQEAGAGAARGELVQLLTLLDRPADALLVQLEQLGQAGPASPDRMDQLQYTLQTLQTRFDCSWELLQLVSHARLLERQQQLTTQLAEEASARVVVGSSLHHTLHSCSLSPDQGLAAGLRASFRIAPVRFALVQLNAMAKRGDWCGVRSLLMDSSLAAATLPNTQRHHSRAAVASQPRPKGSLQDAWDPLGVEAFIRANVQHRGPPRDLDFYVSALHSPIKRLRLSLKHGLYESALEVPELGNPQLWLVLADVVWCVLGHSPRTAALRAQLQRALNHYVTTGRMGSLGEGSSSGGYGNSIASLQTRQQLRASWEKTDLCRHSWASELDAAI
eukprot:g49842.t1